MKKMYIIPLVLIIGVVAYAITKVNNNPVEIVTIENNDLKQIDSITIGSQKWMRNNLNVVRFRNGDIIEQAKSKEQWKQAGLNKKPVWCYYLFDQKNSNENGILYNYYAVVDKRGLAPKGWQIPKIEDWKILITNLGDAKLACNQLKSLSGWKENKNGTNSSDFNAKAAGLIDRDGGFCCKGEIANWWSSTINESDDAWIIAIGSDHDDVGIGTAYKNAGISVRCIAESTEVSSIKIGNQLWMQSNLNVDYFRNGDKIFEAKTNEEWIKAGKEGKPAWCYYNNDRKTADKHGKHYNWFAVNDPRGLTPIGWRIPSDEDWSILEENLGGEKLAGKKIKTINEWLENGAGTNETKFYAYPSGGRSFDGIFDGLGWGCGWWTSLNYDTENALLRSVRFDDNEIHRGIVSKQSGMPIRCIKE